ncbi:MAG TPA: hypothetical protein VG145_00795, partial [Xanthobacteraceae bacterium]|nr:hypothetical protein [Xanthobacteraceae bacterium]
MDADEHRRVGDGFRRRPQNRTGGSTGRTAACRFGLVIALTLAALPARAAVLDETDTSRLAGLNEAIQTFEDDVSAALHDLPSNDAEQIESYAYVQLNLEAAHERLNTIFMLVAICVYMDSASDQSLAANVMHAELLPRSKSYLNEKMAAIASMAAAHPASKVFAAYSTRASALLAD